MRGALLPHEVHVDGQTSNPSGNDKNVALLNTPQDYVTSGLSLDTSALPEFRKDEKGRNVPIFAWTTDQIKYLNLVQFMVGVALIILSVAVMREVYPWPRSVTKFNYTKTDFLCVCIYVSCFPLGFCLTISSVSRIASFPYISAAKRSYFLFGCSVSLLLVIIWFLIEDDGHRYFTINKKWPKDDDKKYYRPELSFEMFILGLPFVFITLGMSLRIAGVLPNIFGPSTSANRASEWSRMNVGTSLYQQKSSMLSLPKSRPSTIGIVDNGSLLPGARLMKPSERAIGITTIVSLMVFMCLYFATTILPSDWTSMDPQTIYHIARSKIRAVGYGFGQNSGNWKWGDLNLHMYPDVYVYYLFLISVLFCGTVLKKYSPRWRKLMRSVLYLYPKPITHPITGLPAVFHIQYGQLICVSLLFGVTAFVFIFMFYYHDYAVDGFDNRTADLARTVGILAVMYCGLLLIPVSRGTRLLVDAFGLSFEGCIQYHRYLGGLFFAFSALHIILMIVCFVNYRLPVSNDRLITKAYPFSKVPWIWEKGQEGYHNDNFSIPLMYLVTIFVLIPGLMIPSLINKIRRAYWEWWYFLHIYSTGVIVISLMFHASQGWYYMIPGMALQFYDRMYRLWVSSIEREVISLEQCSESGVTHICLNDCTPHVIWPLGGYCFINVPHISPFEWHPFSVSNPVNSDTLHFYVKSMTEDNSSFSRRLNQMAYAYSLQSDLDLSISVEGPHGIDINFDDYSHIVLVAGGIGITPLHAVFSSLLKEYLNNQSEINQDIPYVTLIWVVRYAESFNAFQDTLNLIRDSNQNNQQFKVKLFATKERQSVTGLQIGSGGPSHTAMISASYDSTDHNRFTIPYHSHRPNLEEELKELEAYSDDGLVFSCGPPALVQKALLVAHKQGNHFKSESFLW